MDELIEVKYIDRVKHAYSHHRTNDDELAYARTIGEEAESIEIVTNLEREETETSIYTNQCVYHFSTFRADYIGHASRTLLQLLEHFHVRLPIEFITSHVTLKIFITGKKIITGSSSDEKEYPIDSRGGIYELVEPIEWLISSAILDSIYHLAEKYEVQPVEIAESATGTFFSLLELAEEYQVTPDEIISTLTTLVLDNRTSKPVIEDEDDSDVQQKPAEATIGTTTESVTI